MTLYQAPLADIDFTLNHVVDLAAIAKLNGFQHGDPESVRAFRTKRAAFSPR